MPVINRRQPQLHCVRALINKRTSDTCVDNFGVVDKVPSVTRSDVRDGCERGDTCVDDPSVGDNEPYATHIYF